MRDWAKKKAGRAPGWLDPRLAYQDGQDDQDGDGDVVNVMVVMVVKMVTVVIIMIKIKMWGWAKRKMTNVQNPKVKIIKMMMVIETWQWWAQIKNLQKC